MNNSGFALDLTIMFVAASSSILQDSGLPCGLFWKCLLDIELLGHIKTIFEGDKFTLIKVWLVLIKIKKKPYRQTLYCSNILNFGWDVSVKKKFSLRIYSWTVFAYWNMATLPKDAFICTLKRKTLTYLENEFLQSQEPELPPPRPSQTFIRSKYRTLSLHFWTCFHISYVQSNLCATTALGTSNLWPLLRGGRCPEATLCYKDLNWESVVDRWSLFGGGNKLRFDCIYKNFIKYLHSSQNYLHLCRSHRNRSNDILVSTIEVKKNVISFFPPSQKTIVGSFFRGWKKNGGKPFFDRLIYSPVAFLISLAGHQHRGWLAFPQGFP